MKRTVSPTARQVRTLAFLLALGLTAAGCAHCPVCGASWGAARREREAAALAASVPQLETLHGTITCLERVTPLPTYRLVVRLIDLETHEEIASQDLGALKGFPVFFSIVYDARKIQPMRIYGLVCDLTSRGVALYSTDTQYRVLAKDSQREVDLVLTRNLGGDR